MRLVRTITFALVFLAGFHLVAATVETRAVLFLLGRAGFGGLIPLSLAAAAGVTRDKGVLVATLLGVLLAVLPCSAERLAIALSPLGLGTVMGIALGHGIRAAKEDPRGESIHGSAPDRN